MICPSREEMQRYADGELPGDATSRISRHIAECPSCRALQETIARADGSLRAYGAGRRLTRSRGCPGEETVAAFADGSISSPAERASISAHIGACARCAALSAAAAGTARFVEEIEKSGLPELPARLARRIEERFFPRTPVLIGSAAAKIRDILAGFLLPREGVFPTAAPAQALEFAEPRGDYAKRAAGKTPAPRAPAKRPPHKAFPPARGMQWSFAGAGLSIWLEVYGTPSGAVACRISVGDDAGRRLAGVPVSIESRGRPRWSSRTGARGEARCRGLAPGRYLLTVSHGAGARVKLELT